MPFPTFIGLRGIATFPVGTLMPTTMGGERAEEGGEIGWLQARQGRLVRAAMCAHTAGQRRICRAADRAGPGSPGEAEGWCRALQGTGRPLDQSPALAAGRPGLSTEGEAPHRGAGAPAGRAASSLRPLQARHRPGVPPAGASPFAGAAAPPPTSPRPPHLSLLTSAALRTDGASRPSQKTPRRAGAREAGHRRTSAQAAAAASRRAPLRSPITRPPSSASRIGGRPGRGGG